MKILPEKTIERLSQYRRTLNNFYADHNSNRIFSHELAALLNITAVQVRRDIMFIGYSSSQRKGYNVQELIQVISQIIDTHEPINVAVVGYGNLGKAITTYFVGNRPKLNLVAAFDIDPKKIGQETHNIKCYSIDRLREILVAKDITIAILTVPTHAAKDMAKILVQTGIKGILNYTTVNLHIPPEIYLEEYDMITSLEKVAYFVKNKNQ
ncbi:MAG: redox-sensing transcriptional repressor Rex [Bacteroidales bacterium]|nr:redox-sensing transcriptional repressor Rex [Bacteroidales bacterium]MBN2819020.1 redox-sensing transcriptional repressor Rex [Bacteroidales bacterium]